MNPKRPCLLSVFILIVKGGNDSHRRWSQCWRRQLSMTVAVVSWDDKVRCHLSIFSLLWTAIAATHPQIAMLKQNLQFGMNAWSHMQSLDMNRTGSSETMTSHVNSAYFNYYAMLKQGFQCSGDPTASQLALQCCSELRPWFVLGASGFFLPTLISLGAGL